MPISLTSTGVTYPDATTQTGPAGQQLLNTTVISGSPTFVQFNISASDGYSSYLVVLENVNVSTNTTFFVAPRQSNGGNLSPTYVRGFFGPLAYGMGTNSSSAYGTPGTVQFATSTGLNYMYGVSGQYRFLMNATKQAAVVLGEGTYRSGATATSSFELAYDVSTANSGVTYSGIRVYPGAGTLSGGTIWFYGVK